MKPCILTALSLNGDPPLPGHFIKSERGRTAYMVLGVRRSRPGSKAFGRITVERCAPALPAGAVVHRWAWAKR